MKNLTTLTLGIFLLVIGLLFPQRASADPDKEKEEYKRQLYEQANHDPAIQQIVAKLKKDPKNKALMDELLALLPISPLDMFRIRMESQFREYKIPTEVMDLHKKWKRMHPEAGAAQKALADITALTNPQYQSFINATVGPNGDLTSDNYDGEIQLAVNKNNTNQMVASANSWGCDILSVFRSSDGGNTWNSGCAPYAATFGLTCPAGNSELGSDPAVFWNNSGTVYLNYMLLCCNSACQAGTANPTSSLVSAKSTDVGATWTKYGVIVNHLSSTSLGFDDKQFYAIDNTPTSPFYGRHYQCWDNNNDERIAWSSNGTTWNEVNTPKGTSGDLDLGCEMAVGKNGTVHMIFDGLSGCASTCTGEKTYYTRSTDGGLTWSTPVTVKSHTVVSFHTNSKIPAQNSRGINPFGAIDIDNSGGSRDGYLYVTYSDSTSTSAMSNADIYVKKSTDNGATWQAEVKVNNDGTSTAQFHPFLAVDQTNGNVVAGWHDARNDTTNNRKVDFYMSRSTDGGVTWEANTKVSQPSTAFAGNTTISYSDENSTDNSGANPNNYGEYLGVDAHAGKAWMAWTDTRNYFPTAGPNAARKEDVGFATIDFGASGDTTAPTTSVTAPASGATVSGASVAISANASDNVGVTNVEFLVDSTVVGSDSTSPYGITWNSTTVTNGSHSISSRAYDAAGNAGVSSAVSVTVSNTGSASFDATLQAPKCTTVGTYCDSGTLLTGRGTMSPAEANQPNTINDSCADGNSGTFHSDESLDKLYVATTDSSTFAAGKTVQISATVWCWGTADHLDLYYAANANSPSWTFIATKDCTVSGAAATLTASYTLPSGSLQAIRGTYRYNGSASACGTNSGYDDHDDLIFAVGAGSDTTAPTTSITAPTAGSTVSGTITVSANASDNVGVTNVQFYIDGTTLIGSDTTSPYSVSWNTTSVLNGSHSLTSKAYDAAGNAGTSAAVSITVNNAVPDTTAPATSITSPTSGSTVSGTITISANASDNVGVTKVDFYRGATLMGTDTTSPYTMSWNTTTVSNGTYALTTKAYDAASNVGTSAAVSVTVNNGGGLDLTATYSSTYRAPACPAGGKSCDTGASLINGRGTMTNGNETNRPNTINSTCVDGNSGTYHVDESIDRMKIATNDGTAFAAGKAVTITFTVYCYNSTDRLDVYRTATAFSPSWTLIGTQACTAAGVKTFTATYTLPTGANQAVRGSFRYGGSAATCTSGNYNDRDDLVFGVN